ncbi:putative Leucine-rich receptor-like kinase family protein [Quillaja saponaria]|uniref:Leucine-rich receptor-like kinase family protein n=1 Tax=Quillaja saponaria TaxID=32244 RepID=A0AAD7L5V4_QUISA|nr:putative Leucine-rich receptor-like kinase family protein [Quillaja saponaria]
MRSGRDIGGIPSQLTELCSLAIFNVSYNNLSGTTPTTGQFANFDENNYRGNSGLCGTLLKKSCTSTMSSPPPPALPDGEEGKDSEIDLESFYRSFAASYVTILMGITIILCVNPHWRRAWHSLWFSKVLVSMQSLKGCLEKERIALLDLKASLMISQNDLDLLPSWVDDTETDCCGWERVQCNVTTGHVIGLSLEGVKSWEVGVRFLNITLFDPFKELQWLGFQRNFISGVVQNEDLAVLKSLETLDLCSSGLSSYFVFEGPCRLKKLVELNLSQNRINNLPDCLGNLTNLRFLDILSSNLNGSIPSFITNLRSLEYLSLFDNNFEGLFSFSSLANHSKLVVFLLSSTTDNLHVETETSAWFPTFQLKVIQLKNCNLNLQTNRTIPSFLLYQDDLRNSFEGILPSSIEDMPTLRMLDLSSSIFFGDLPRHLFSNFTSLTLLRLSHNNFHGQILPKFATLDRLRWLYLNNNSFTGNMEDGVLNRSRLNILDISNNFVSGRIPRWIGIFYVLKVLLMSKNHLQGEIPVELCNLSSLRHLDLSENRLSGFMPPCFNNHFTSLKFLYLQKNSLTGYIPYLSPVTSFASADLRDNNFSGEIPHWMNSFRDLRVLLLGGNELHGPIPTQSCQFDSVKLMDLSHNRLSGSIPSCFNNISFQMEEHKTSVEGSSFDEESGDTFWYYFNTIWSIFTVDVIWFIPEVEFRTKNYYHSYKGTIVDYMAGLDLSSNNLTGIIPPQIGELNQIAALNLSYNRLSGSIPDSFSNLTEIESLDLSYNNLNGGIPSQLTELYSLAIFNVSYNNLSGTTPTTGQSANFDENNYRGNSGLCGTLLKKSCTNAMSPPPPPALADGEEGEDSEIDLRVFLLEFCSILCHDTDGDNNNSLHQS